MIQNEVNVKRKSSKMKNAPHQAVILLTCEIMEKLRDGRVSGFPVKIFSKVFPINGKDYEDCVSEVNTFINKIVEVYDEQTKNV